MQSRKLLRAEMMVLALGVFAALAGARVFDFFPDSRGMPLQFAVLLFLAVLLVTSVGSPVPGLDEMESGTLFRAQVLHMWVGFTLGVLISILVSMVAAPEARTGGARAFIAWYGLGLISAAFFGWEKTWIIPIAVVLPLMWFGTNFTAANPVEWNWVLAPPSSTVSWGTVGGVLLVGSIAIGVRLNSRR